MVKGLGLGLGNCFGGRLAGPTQFSLSTNSATWNKTRCTVLVDAATGPDGAMSAEKIVEDTSVSASHFIMDNVTTPVLPGLAYEFILYAKAAERGFLSVQADGNGGLLGGHSAINLTTGAVINTAAGVTSITVDTLPNGWFCIHVLATATATGSASPLVAIRSVSGSGLDFYTGDGASGILVWEGILPP